MSDELYDYIEEYDAHWLLNEFAHRSTDIFPWVLINPMQYHKALYEFVRFGRFTSFPTDKVYQFMGIIMKNTCIITQITNLAGHSQYFPDEDFMDFLSSYLPRLNWECTKHYEYRVYLTFAMLEELLKDGKLNLYLPENGPMNEVSMHRDGQLNAFLNRSEVDQFDRNEEFKKSYQSIDADLVREIEAYNADRMRHRGMPIEFDSSKNAFYVEMSGSDMLDCLGFFDWAVLKNGEDAYSDYGLEPIYNILSKYNDSLSPEETIVLVNKVLDVYHQRSDLAYAFIDGGSKALSKISESIEKSGKSLIKEDDENLDNKFKATPEWMARKYDEFNQSLFGGRLGRCNFRIFTTGKGSEGRILGWFKLTSSGIKYKRSSRRMYKYDVFGDEKYINHENFYEMTQPTIELNGHYSGTEDSLSATLVHEMCHYYNYMYGYVPARSHGRDFMEIAGIVSSRSNGRFTIKGVASAEEMSGYQLDADMQARRDKRTQTKKNGSYAILMSFQDGTLRLSMVKNVKLVGQWINDLSFRAKYHHGPTPQALYVSSDPRAIEFFFARNYKMIQRTLRYWDITKIKNDINMAELGFKLVWKNNNN